MTNLGLGSDFTPEGKKLLSKLQARNHLINISHIEVEEILSVYLVL
jgi:hypothetical protein